MRGVLVKERREIFNALGLRGSSDRKRFITAVAVLVGTCIGAGVLGIPYVAAQTGFFITLIYIFAIGGVVLLVNLYLGEIALRTEAKHQLPGYAERYIGKWGSKLMEFATVFGIYSAIVAYMLGVGESFSFLFFGNGSYTTLIGVLFGVGMSGIIWRGIKALKRFEKIGVLIVLVLLAVIFFVFVDNVTWSNLYSSNISKLFLPFGVVLFALLSFHAIPEVEIVLHKREKFMKSVIITSILISIVFYILFTLVVVGFKGVETPEVATLVLGPVFIFLGILTMFTSYLAIGNALQENFILDERYKKKKAWFLTTIIPIIIFLIIQLGNLFSFTMILSIGGVVAGGITGILILLMVKEAKKHGDRKPEYKMPSSWILITILCSIFIIGILLELF